MQRFVEQNCNKYTSKWRFITFLYCKKPEAVYFANEDVTFLVGMALLRLRRK